MKQSRACSQLSVCVCGGGGGGGVGGGVGGEEEVEYVNVVGAVFQARMG